jgi:hypothetical protein
MAGADFPASLLGRADAVQKKIRRKYAKFLRHIEWSKDELREMSPSMARELEGWNKMKTATLSRLAWNAAAYFASIADAIDFADLNASPQRSAESEPLWLGRLRRELEGLLSDGNPHSL